MMVIRSCLTIVFDGSFYKAVWECHDGNQYSVASVMLGSTEPKMSLILRLVNKGYQRFHFHHVESENPKMVNRLNPKRAQRLANKAMRSRGISTKAQVTLQKQFEEKKKLRKTKRTNKNRLNKEIRYQKRVVKRRKKHRGH